MARPPKIGLDYFPLDVDFFDDYKIIDLLNRYGTTGVIIYLIIIGRVYRNGYYLQIPKEHLVCYIMRTVGNRWIREKDFVLQVIEYCADIGLFDKTLLGQSVITSVGIQRRYHSVTVRNKVHKDKYWLLEETSLSTAESAVPKNSVSAAEIPVSVTGTPIYVTEMPQKKSKVKKSKVNESKADESKTKKIILSIPLKNGRIYDIFQDRIDNYQQQFSAIDVLHSLRRLAEYMYNNPNKRKDIYSIENYIMLWFEEDEEKIHQLKQENSDTHHASYDLSILDGIGLLD